MKIAVIGAGGWIGGVVAHEAIARGHEVTALGRDVGKLEAVEGAAERASVDVTEAASIAGAVDGADAVVASVTDRSSDEARGVIVTAAHELIAGLPRAGVRRLLFVGGGGSLEQHPGQRFVDGAAFPAEYKPEALAQAEALALLRAEGGLLHWTYLSPPPVNLLAGEARGGYTIVSGDAPARGAEGELTVGDLAAVALDELEQDRYLGERINAAY